MNESQTKNTTSKTVLTTFSFKHGVAKTAIHGVTTIKEFENSLRKALQLPASKYDLKVVNTAGVLVDLAGLSFKVLGTSVRTDQSRSCIWSIGI